MKCEKKYPLHRGGKQEEKIHSTFDLATFYLATFDLATFDLATFDLATFDFATFDLATFDLATFDLASVHPHHDVRPPHFRVPPLAKLV